MDLTSTTARLLVLLLLLGIASCTKQPTAKKDDNVDYWTCTMHPSVHSKDPGKCPICSMDLVPVMKKGASAAAETAASTQSSEFQVPVERQQQIGVTYATVGRRPLELRIRSVGFVASDKSREWQFVARVDGYVQKLFVTSAGESVSGGEPLLSIYSPDLLTSEHEFVDLLRVRGNAGAAVGETPDPLIDAAKQRLLQWNVTPQQVDALEKSRKPEDTLTLLSPFRGVVQSVPVAQGQGVKVGDPLISVTDLSVVWVWASFYEDELRLLKNGQKVTITTKAYPGKMFAGTISLISPFLDEMNRTVKVRIDIPNADFSLRPGMYVNIDLSMNMGEGLAIPVNAVMPTGERNIVYVDKGEGRIEPRLVQLDGTYGDYYAVQSGLQAGERVVSSANFLIDAEAKVQGALQSFDEDQKVDANSAAGEVKNTASSEETLSLYVPFIATYLSIHDSLAADKFDDVSQEIETLRKQIDAILYAAAMSPDATDSYRQQVGALKAAAGKFRPGSLDTARVQFGKFSDQLISLLTAFPALIEHPLTVMKCPMWQKSPAQWIQVGSKVENPFLGQQMPDCGVNVGSLQAGKQ